MDLSSIKTVQITEKNLNPNGILLFDNYIKKMVSNYLVSWISNSDKTLSMFYLGNPPAEVGDVDSVYRGYGVGGREKRIVANAYYESMPPEARNLTGVNDIDGVSVHGLALLEDKTITGWSMTGDIYPFGWKEYVTTSDSIWKQSRYAATGGALLRNVKKIGADQQSSFALLEGDILTGWGQVYSYKTSSNSSRNRPLTPNLSLATYGSGTGYLILGDTSYYNGWGGTNSFIFDPQNTTTYINVTSGNCVGLAMSANGRRKISVIQGGYLGQDEASFSFGSTTKFNQKKNWTSCASAYDSDGSIGLERLIATVSGGNIWTGNYFEWKEISVDNSPKNWTSCAIDYYGNNQTATAYGEKIWVSNNYGATWQSKATNQNWTSVSMSSGGKYQTAVAYNGNIWISTDFGNNWIQKGIVSNWKSVAVAQEGKYQTAVASPGKIYTSSDSGNSWIEKNIPGIRNWSNVALGHNGDIQVAVSNHLDNNGSVWISTDTGYNWSDITSYITGVLTNLSWPNSQYKSQPKGWNSVAVDKNFTSPGNFFTIALGNSTISGGVLVQTTAVPHYSGFASEQIPFASYPTLYLTGVKDFDVGENYINILFKTGSPDSYMMSGWGSVPTRLKNDGLRDVKKVIATRDHTFALLKSGNTTVISGWGLTEQNLDQFERWVWGQYAGGVSGWFGGFLNDYKMWTGIKDFDVGYNHGIAIFEDDKVSGWCSSSPAAGKNLIAQINSKYKTVLDAKMNFYLDAPSFSGDELVYSNEITPYKLKLNKSLNQWEAVSDINSLNPVAYRSKEYGSGALIGTWEGVGDSQGQQLEVVNSTVQSIYPIEIGEAYISAVSDKDWIQIDKQNLIFPWNKTVAYVGSTGTPIEVYNLPTGINYNFVTPNTSFTPYEGAQPTTFQSIYNANNINSQNFSQYGIDSQGRYHSTNTYVPYKVRFSDNDFGKNWTTGISNDNKRYTSLSMDPEGKVIVTVNAEGDICASSNSGKDWSRRSAAGYSWKSVDYNRSSSISGNIYLTDYNGFVYCYPQTGLGDDWNAFPNPSLVSFSPRKINSSLQFSRVNFVKSFPNTLVIPNEYLIGTITTYHDNGMNNNNAQIIGEKSGTLKITLNGGTAFDEIYNVFGTEEPDRTNFLIPPNEWVDIACSQNYEYTIALRKNKAPLYSDNSMMNFSEVLPTGNWTSAAISKDGKYMLIASSGQGVYQSIDFGATWIKTPIVSSTVASNRNYTSCSMSNDGKFQAFAADRLYIYMSKDYGLNWSLSNSTSSIGARSWSSLKINNFGDNMLACSTLTGTQTPGSIVVSSGCVVASQIPKSFVGGVTLYPTTDYPLTVYRETSGVSSSAEMSRTITPEMGINEMQTSELFLYQNNSKSGEWILSLRYLKDFLFGSFAFDKGEEIIASQAKSFDEIVGYAFPPRGLWNNFYTRDSNNNRTVLNTGLSLEYSIIDQIKSTDSRTGYMQDVNFYIDYSKMLPNYPNENQVFRNEDDSLSYTQFGANITVKDASLSNWTFNQNGVIEANPDFAVNVARFVSDTGVTWNKTVTNPICGGYFNSANIYDTLGNNETPLRSVYIGPDFSTTRSDNTWYIFIKFFSTGFNNFSGTNRWGNFKWKTPYMFDKSSNTKIPFISEIYSPYNPSRGLPLWSGVEDNWELPIYSGLCYHIQVRLYHPLLNSGAYANQERNIWSQLSTTGTYSGGYFWNGIEDQGSGELSAGLSLERGREYRFIQERPINDTNKLKIYPNSGVEVYEYDSDNSSDYRFIQVKIKSEDANNKYISWSKGDQSYITGFTGNFASSRGNYTIGKFYETDITGIIPDPANPNYIKYSSNQASGEWYFNSTIENKMLGTIRFLDKLYPAEFWYLSGLNYNTWPNDKANGFKTQNAYAFLKSGDVKIPFYGTLVQTAKGINTGIFNPNGNGSSQKHIWNGRFKVIGKNDYTMRANYTLEYPNPGDKNPFDLHICTDYNLANDATTWEFLSKPLAQRSGFLPFSGVVSSGYFFADCRSNIYARDTILCRKNGITNIVFVPPTQARLTANKIAFWTGSSKTGPWAEVTGAAASIFGGNENFYNVNSLDDIEPSVSEAFGEVWQLIQLYVPNTVNSSQIFAKFGPKNSNPSCALGTGCRHTNLVVIDDGLPPLSPSGYYQLTSGNNILKTTVNYSKPNSALFKGNVNVWSSDPYFTKQIPVQLTGARDYILYS